MIEDKSRGMHFQTLFEHFRTMKLNVYFLFLALSVYATPQLMTAVQEILQLIRETELKDDQTFRIPTPAYQNVRECVSTILRGVEQLETHPEKEKFSKFVHNFNTIKKSLSEKINTQENCDTESVTVSEFMSRLNHLIKTEYLLAKQSDIRL